MNDNIGLVIGVILGVALLTVGLVNYIKTFKSVSTGTAPVKKTVPPMPKPTSSKSVKSKKLLPISFLIIGILLSIMPFFLRAFDLVYGFRLSEVLGLQSLWRGLSSSKVEYKFQMLLFVINAIIATLLLFLAFYRQSQKNHKEFWETIVVFLCTYGIAALLLYGLCCMLGGSVFGSSDSGPMLYTWIAYSYLIIWVIADALKGKKI